MILIVLYYINHDVRTIEKSFVSITVCLKDTQLFKGTKLAHILAHTSYFTQ